MTLLASHADAEVHHCDWRLLADVVRDRGGCDASIFDAPYSAKTHAGHDDGVASTERMRNFATLTGGQEKDRRYAIRKAERGETHRKPLGYAAWGEADVAEFVNTWAPITNGWMVSITDDVLAHSWQRAFQQAGRYAFAPLPFVAPGSRVRLTGDGPSAWSCWIVVSRPRSKAFATWGTLDGAYVLPPGFTERPEHTERVVGGKPLWLMERLVEDYSRPGDLVVDPCCGAGTTLVAAQRTGRKAIGGDVLREHADLAAKRISRPAQQPLFAAGGSR